MFSPRNGSTRRTRPDFGAGPRPAIGTSQNPQTRTDRQTTHGSSWWLIETEIDRGGYRCVWPAARLQCGCSGAGAMPGLWPRSKVTCLPVASSWSMRVWHRQHVMVPVSTSGTQVARLRWCCPPYLRLWSRWCGGQRGPAQSLPHVRHGVPIDPSDIDVTRSAVTTGRTVVERHTLTWL